MIHDRTPFVTVELQLRPQPPPGARPYWWGYGKLTFYVEPVHERVWDGDFADLVGRGSHAMRVREDLSFGWILVLTFTHDKARAILSGMNLPDFAAGRLAVEEATTVAADAD